MYRKPLQGAIETGMSIDIYTMLCDGEWWACTPDGRQLVFEGEGYRKICEVNYIGQEGTKELGMFKITKIRNLAPYKYEFTFVSNDLMPAYALMETKCFRQYYDFKS